MYLFFERIVASSGVKDIDDTTVSATNLGKSTMVELQADTANVRYTMDNVTAPSVTSGMRLLTTSEPKTFLIEDFRKIKFIREGGSDGGLNIHYFAGRNI